MSFSAKSLFSQKKGTIYSLAFLAVIAALVVGIILVSALHARTITPSPVWTAASLNQTYNFTIANSGPGNVNLVEITKPSSFVDIFCVPPVTTGWTCSTNGTKAGQTFVRLTGGTLASGASATFNISSTTASTAGEVTFTVKTEDDQSAFNSTNVIVSIDTMAPKIDLMNVTDGTNILSGGGHLDGTRFLLNSTGKISVVFNATDNESNINSVILYFNATNDTIFVVANQSHYDGALIMSNGSYGPHTLWNATFEGNNILNGTRIVFIVVANDSARNVNVSNYTILPNDRVYNFTIDAAAPRLSDVQILNFSQVNINAENMTGINTTRTSSSLVEYILNSTLALNLSALVTDDGGSGVVKVEIMNGSGNFTNFDNIITGSNGSSSTRNIFGLSITNFTRPAFSSDGLYNLSFRITDNLSQVTLTNVSVEVDDTPPTGSVSTQNLTFAGKLSAGNVTTNASNPVGKSSNLTFIVRLQAGNNINNLTRNVSVFGNLGLIHNLSYESGTTSGTSYWNLSVGLYNTTPVPANAYNLSEFCAMTDTDGSTCNLRFNFSDVLGRFNDTLNLTVAVDLLAPNVSIVSPVSLTTNYTGSVLINASVNDSVGPLSNVSFRWRNASGIQTNNDLEGSNVSNWMPMTLNAGSNSQFNAQGYYTATLTISSLVDGNYSIEINATDSGGRQNTTTNRTNVIFDSTPPQNITTLSPSSNNFHRIQFNITTNASDRVSGLRNVSFRLENGSFNWPWVEATSTITALTMGESFNASNWNLTHFGGGKTNATNGNFSVRFNVTDTAGNQNTSITVNVTIDTILPMVSFTTPLNNLNQSGNFTINVSVTESNVNTVQFRWVNDSSSAVIGSARSEWVLLSVSLGGLFNRTFTNFTDGYTSNFRDGNYSLEVNVTDFAGNQNTSVFVQLILDNNAPVIVAKGSNTTNLVADINLTTDFVVNLTINDTTTWNMNLGKIGTTNINSSAFRLENATFNGSWVGMDFATRDLTSTESNRTNASFTFSSVPNGLYNVRFMVNDTAGNQNNTVQISRVMLDNVAPKVTLTAANVSPVPSGGAGLSGTITFNASVTDNLPVNISINTGGSNVSTQGNTFGVFYRFESVSVTTAWLPMSSIPIQSTPAPHDKIVFNASNITTTLADGDYRLRINVTDSAGNQNTTVYVDITVQNGGQVLQAANETFLEGLWNGIANSSTDTYTFLLNTTGNATCRYSLDNSRVVYNDFGAQSISNTMTNNVSREHRISFGSRRDIASGGHRLFYECKGLGASINYTGPGGADSVSQFPFGIDTRSRWNVTIPGKTSNNWPNYFQAAAGGSANGWSSFVLATGQLADTTLVGTGTYNVTQVLSSLMSGTAAGNYTRIYAYTANTNSWEAFRVGQTGNNFINFTNQTTYWINVTAVERLEIN